MSQMQSGSSKVDIKLLIEMEQRQLKLVESLTPQEISAKFLGKLKS